MLGAHSAGIVSCVNSALSSHSQHDAWPSVVLILAGVRDGGPVLNRHWLNIDF